MRAIPVTVLTGFLGSGKTTLLNRLLERPEMAKTAVLINEFGEVGIDHLLVRRIDETVVLLNSGCICCTVRGDLVEQLSGLHARRGGEVPEFDRVMIETTGLADPAPIIHTLMAAPEVAGLYRLDGIVTTVDLVVGGNTLDRQPEAVKQAAVADRLVLTKADIADPVRIEELRARLFRLNPGAEHIVAAHGEVDPDRLLEAGLFNARSKGPDVARWLNDEAIRAAHPHHHHHHDVNRHDERIEAFVFETDTPVSWTALAFALDTLSQAKGENLLRVKGIVNAEGVDRPLVLHGVQHVFHPAAALPAWPDDDRRTRIVFITRDLPRQTVLDFLNGLLAEPVF